MAKELSLNNIIYKQYPFLFKNSKEFEEELNHSRLNSNQINSLINELQFKINNKKFLTFISTIFSFILSIYSLYISCTAFLYSIYFQDLSVIDSLKEKLAFINSMTHTYMYKDIKKTLLLYSNPNSWLLGLITILIVYSIYSTYHTFRLKKFLSFLYSFQRELLQ
ncbi:hypothetical protein [uncultured Lactobacillus sp.]|uniref:hypothetical protein n=1 Tax=uncultured Lactobacillus sp. TaxID=153152 RepID=UPI00272D09B8|nr:hypothetical protein [uncultured Lactobacillus sp.]